MALIPLRVRSLPSNRSGFAAKPTLDSLRKQHGHGEFGYRMQAIFAHVILRLGGKILEVNAQGHPDVRAVLGDRELVVQVKTSSHSWAGSMFEMNSSDFSGIGCAGRREGLLAFLDCAEPVRWIMVRSDRARAFVGRLVHVSTLQAESDEALSEDCTEEFLEIIVELGDRLLNLTYPLLRVRALRQESL